MKSLVNKEMCTNCKSRCCEREGGLYSPSDFGKITEDRIMELLQDSRVTFFWEHVATADDAVKQFYARPTTVGFDEEFVNADKDVGGRCSNLTADGCELEFNQRPKGCRELMPKTTSGGICHPHYSKEQCIAEWSEYTEILEAVMGDVEEMKDTDLFESDYSDYSDDDNEEDAEEETEDEADARETTIQDILNHWQNADAQEDLRRSLREAKSVDFARMETQLLNGLSEMLSDSNSDFRRLQKEHTAGLKTDAELCAACGGKCCKRKGCTYAPSDFEKIDFETLKQEIDKGYISIDWKSDMNVKRIAQRGGDDRLYYLRSRHVGTEVISPDFGGVCRCLTADGCMYDFEHRPKGGRELKPNVAGSEQCVQNYTDAECCEDWLKYTDVLKKLMTNYGGYSKKREAEMLEKNHWRLKKLGGFIPRVED